MAVSISISITQKSQSIANNTSTCNVAVKASWTGGSNNRAVNASGVPQANGWVKVGSQTVNFNSTFNDKQTTTGSKTIFSQDFVITHNSDGTKKLDVSASYTTYVSSGTVTASASKTLTTIPRKSTLSINVGTGTTTGELGTKQTLTVTEQASSFTHTITAKCGTASTTICTKSTNNSISFTPPLDWAKQNTTGTSVSVTYTITTYNGNTSVGSNTYTKTCSIPASVKPSCSISVEDPTGYCDTYGAYVKGYSKFEITVTPAPAYDSAINSYKIIANDATYTSGSFTTDVLKVSGDEVSISATVTDKRGRTSPETTQKVNVLDYAPPRISTLNVGRGDIDDNGNFVSNDQGEYVKVKFEYSYSSLNDQNGVKSCVLGYKKTTDDDYTIPSDFVPDNDSYIFAADTGSSYDVLLTVEDHLEKTSKATSASTAFTIRHLKANGRGVAFGKISEFDDVFDIGFATRFTGGIKYILLEEETHLDECHTPGFYVGENVSSYNYGNCPLTSGTFVLEVLSMGDNGQLMQRLTQCNIRTPIVYERMYYKSAGWGEWFGGWMYPTLESNFTMYGSSSSDNKPKYRKDGRIVEVRGIVTPASDIAGSTTMYNIFTLPEGYRPNSPIYSICQGSGNCTWLLRVNTNGELGFSRYRNGSETATASAGAWLPFQVTFLV